MHEHRFSKIYQDQAEKYTEYAQKAFSWLYIMQPSLDRNIDTFYRKNVRVLDAGCGDGRIVRHLIDRGVDSNQITAVDFSQELLNIAKQKSSEVNFLLADLSSADLPTGAFDLITCSMVLECLDGEGLRKVLENFRMWLKNGGTLFYITTHPFRMTAQNASTYTDRGWKESESPWGTKIPFFYRTVGDFVNETARAGFRIETLDEASVLPEAKNIDSDQYNHYFSHGVSRLAVKAIKEKMSSS